MTVKILPVDETLTGDVSWEFNNDKPQNCIAALNITLSSVAGTWVINRKLPDGSYEAIPGASFTADTADVLDGMPKGGFQIVGTGVSGTKALFESADKVRN